MKRLRALLVAVIAGSVASESLPVPPLPPAHVPASDAAPLPNVDAAAPKTDDAAGGGVNVKLYRFQPPDPSQGFVPGSHYQSTEDRKAIQTPGFSVSVPLQ